MQTLSLQAKHHRGIKVQLDGNSVVSMDILDGEQDNQTTGMRDTDRPREDDTGHYPTPPTPRPTTS